MHSVKRLRLVSACDPAIDFVGMGRGLAEYMKHREFERLKFHEGKTPTVFETSRLDAEVMQRFVKTEPTTSGQYREAFRYGVAKVTNYHDDQGQLHAEVTPSDSIKLPGTTVARFGDEELFQFAPVDVEEIGHIIFTRSFLRPGSAVCFHPPHLLRAALVATQFSRAAELAETLPSSAKSGKHLEADPTASDGAKATAATATE